MSFEISQISLYFKNKYRVQIIMLENIIYNTMGIECTMLILFDGNIYSKKKMEIFVRNVYLYKMDRYCLYLYKKKMKCSDGNELEHSGY